MNEETREEMNAADFVTKDRVEAFTGKGEYFFPPFQKGANPKATSWGWSWPAFFFGPFWLAYRKMYIRAGIYCVLSIVPLFAVVLWLACAIRGNYFYYLKYEGVAKECSGEIECIKTKGGASFVAPIIFFVILIPITLFVGLLMRGSGY